MSDHQWEWEKLCQEHGEEKAKCIVINWLRTMANKIETDSYPLILGIEHKKMGPLVVLSVTTSCPWGG